MACIYQWTVMAINACTGMLLLIRRGNQLITIASAVMIKQLFILGSPKSKKAKSSSDDEGLGEALDVLLNGGGISLVNEDPNNEVDYEDSKDSDLFSLDGIDQASGEPRKLRPSGNANIQSQDTQGGSQPLGSDERTTLAMQPVLTQQGVMELVSKDAGCLLPGSRWKQRKQV
jgi:hypothetical protein